MTWYFLSERSTYGRLKLRKILLKPQRRLKENKYRVREIDRDFVKDVVRRNVRLRECPALRELPLYSQDYICYRLQRPMAPHLSFVAKQLGIMEILQKWRPQIAGIRLQERSHDQTRRYHCTGTGTRLGRW